MTTLQELPAEVQARVAGIIAKWKASHDSRAFDWLDVREFRWDEQRGYFRSSGRRPQWSKVQRGTDEYESNIAHHSNGWWEEIVGDHAPEQHEMGRGYMRTFEDAVREEVEDYLFACAPVLWSTDPDNTDEPGSTIVEILDSLPDRF